MFEKLVLVTALPEDTALLRTDNLPGAQVDDSLVGSVLKENSGRDRGQRHTAGRI